jgi:predicted transcriptional regulator
MTSEEPPPPGEGSAQAPGEPGDLDQRAPAGQAGEARDDRRRLNLTDPKAIRALAHPLRWTLLEAVHDAGTLTATQASEMLGESPANCAFHLRTLAKYGFVEEAGGGRGRERPWRQAYDTMSWQTLQDDPEASHAAEALDQIWLDRSFGRARRNMTSQASWPKGLADTLGGTVRRLHLTPEEAGELYSEVQKTFERFTETRGYRGRRDPKRRPPDALSVEFVFLGYPVLDFPPLPDTLESDGDGETDDRPDSGPASPE